MTDSLQDPYWQPDDDTSPGFFTYSVIFAVIFLCILAANIVDVGISDKPVLEEHDCVKQSLEDRPTYICPDCGKEVHEREKFKPWRTKF